MSEPTTAVFLTQDEREFVWDRLLEWADKNGNSRNQLGELMEKFLPELPYRPRCKVNTCPHHEDDYWHGSAVGWDRRHA